MRALERVLEALGQRVAQRSQSGAQAKCPAHEDSKASLAIKQGDQGVVMKCHAGCKVEDIARAIDLRMSDLFDEPRAAKVERKIVATYPYLDERGTSLYEVVRFEPKDFRQRRPNGNGWDWNLGDVRRVLYHLPALLQSAPRAVFVVEGEKDVHALESLNLVATTNAGGAGKWLPGYGESLKYRNVIVLPDNDTAGRAHAELVVRSLRGIAATARIVALPGLPAKGDASDWVAAGGTREQLLALCKSNPLKERLARIAKELEEIGRAIG